MIVAANHSAGLDGVKGRGESVLTHVDNNPIVNNINNVDIVLVGAGRGQRAIGQNHERTSRAIHGANKGGSKSGAGSGPVIDPEIANAISKLYGSHSSPDSKGERHSYCERFVCGVHPGKRTSLPGGFIKDRLFPYDQGGAPFCGMAAIDVAAGLKPDVDKYIKISGEGDLRPWNTVGNSQFLRTYALSKGHNLAIIMLRARDEDYRGDVIMYDKKNGLPTVVLGFYPSGKANEPGHYVVMFEDFSSVSRVPDMAIPEPTITAGDYAKRAGLALALGTLVVLAPHCLLGVVAKTTVMLTESAALLLHPRKKYTAVGTSVEESDKDVRSLVNQRDRIRTQDTYTHVDVQYGLILSPFPRCEVHMFLPRFFTSHMVVSNTQVNHVYNEMVVLAATGRDPLTCLSSVSSLREVNTHSGRADVAINTLVYLRELAARLEITGVAPSTRGLIATTTNPMTGFIPEVAMRNLIGADTVSDPVGVVNWRRDNKPFTPKVVAVAPIGCCAPAGLIGSTDEAGVLNAFVGRAMCKDKKRGDQHQIDFINFSLKFVSELVEQTPVHGLVENEVREEFAAHYKGKRSSRYIQSAVKEHTDYIEGRMSVRQEKRYCEHGFFVKKESNIKKHQGKYYIRNRGIMTMSPKSKMGCINVVRLIEAWNHGPMSKYQVKGMDNIQMAEKIAEITSGAHCVTDMSAFESSINDSVRMIEEYVLLRLCDRSGFLSTKRALKELIRGVRVLRTRWGDLKLDTRCSGDFWTSFGNGVVNLCLCAYAAHSRGQELKAIVEGDDGLIPLANANPVLMEQAGFVFSSDVSGTQPGDCDFLQSRWVGDMRLLNVARCLKVLWVSTPCRLKHSKLLFLLRCSGASLHHLSPGHPVLFALVNRIGRETRSTQSFKNVQLYLNSYKGQEVVSKYPQDVKVRPEMRALVAQGALGFPPITFAQQLELERRFEEDDEFDLGGLLADYDSLVALRESTAARKGNSSMSMMDMVYTLLDKNGVLRK